MLELERETPKNSDFVSSMTYRGISTIDPFHNNAADESPNDYSYPVNILKGFFAASVCCRQPEFTATPRSSPHSRPFHTSPLYIFLQKVIPGFRGWITVATQQILQLFAPQSMCEIKSSTNVSINSHYCYRHSSLRSSYCCEPF